MKKTMLWIAAVVVLLSSHVSSQQQYDQKKYWKYASPRIEISQTGQAARKQSPECGDAADGIKAVEVVAKAGSAAIDAYLQTLGVPTIGGYGITSALLDRVSNDGNKQWLRDCGASGWDGAWMGTYNLSHSSTDKSTVSCMTAKNWSHNRNRRFWVVATDGINPPSGAALPQVYR